MSVIVALLPNVIRALGFHGFSQSKRRRRARPVSDSPLIQMPRPAAATPVTAGEMLADLGPVLSGEASLHQTAVGALGVVMSSCRARSGALFCLQEEPSTLVSVA